MLVLVHDDFGARILTLSISQSRQFEMNKHKPILTNQIWYHSTTGQSACIEDTDITLIVGKFSIELKTDPLLL